MATPGVLDLGMPPRRDDRDPGVAIFTLGLSLRRRAVAGRLTVPACIPTAKRDRAVGGRLVLEFAALEDLEIPVLGRERADAVGVIEGLYPRLSVFSWWTPRMFIGVPFPSSWP